MENPLDNHYTEMGIEPIVYSDKNKLDPYQHTIIKYVTRWRVKGGLRDLKAAALILQKYIDKEEKEEALKPNMDGFSETDALDNVLRLMKEKGKLNQYTTIVTSGRGGMWAAANLAYALNIEDVQVIPLKEITKMVADDILFVDDIVDTGNTITGMVIDSAVLYIRHTASIIPTFAGVWLYHDLYQELPISQQFDKKGKDVKK